MSVKEPTKLKDGSVEGATFIDVTETITTTEDVNADKTATAVDATVTDTVSATTVSATGTVSANAVSATTVSATGTVSGNVVSTPTVSATDVNTTNVNSTDITTNRISVIETTIPFSASPSSPTNVGDLKIFNDGIGNIKTKNTLGQEQTLTNNLSKVLYQKKRLHNDFPDGGTVSDFGFNVPAGYAYKITFYLGCTNGADIWMAVYNGPMTGLDADKIAQATCPQKSSASPGTAVMYVTAINSQISFQAGGFSGFHLKGELDTVSASRDEHEVSYVVIEQLTNHQPQAW